MASRGFDDTSRSSDEEEEIFPGFSLSKWLKIDRNGREGYKKNLRDVDGEIG